MKKTILLFLAVIALTIGGGIGGHYLHEYLRNRPTCPEEDSSQFVTLTDAVPDAILEIRYFCTYNFVGTRIDGYLEPTALLTRQAADSLRAVSDDLKALGYRLKIYDAYRPQRAVDHFVRWGKDLADSMMKKARKLFIILKLRMTKYE